MRWRSGGAEPAGSALIDERNSLEVELLNESMWLEGRSDAALAAGANLAVLGDEVLQFGRAEPIAGTRFRLSRLLRGRRGTEWAAAGHAVGEPFALVQEDRLAPIQAQAGTTGTQIRVLAQGIGDPADPAAVSLTVVGRALEPPAPAHLKAVRKLGGDIDIRWTRRSRSGWNWTSGLDTPVGEEKESYRLVLAGAGGERSVQLEEPRYTYTSGVQAADGFGGGLRIEVTQIGTHASSRPAILFLD